MEQAEDQMRRAIGTLLQSDPLIKLLQEVRLGRIKTNKSDHSHYQKSIVK